MTPREMRLQTAGTQVRLRSDLPSTVAALSTAAGAGLPSDGPAADAGRPASDLDLYVERARRPFPVDGMVRLTRGAWGDDNGTVVLGSAGGSGWTQRWALTDRPAVHSRWTPTPAERAAAVLLPARRRALEAQVLLHHPALWAAARRGLAPLHVSVVEVEGQVVLLAGPGGLGKSTLVAQALASGARVCCDNVAVSDGTTAWGLAEPMRLDPTCSVAPAADASSAGRTTHGRREFGWRGRVDALEPDVVVVVTRGNGPTRLRDLSAERAARALVAGTFAAGELLRFWPLCAVLGLVTGHGDVLPDVEGIAHELVSRLPCLELRLGPQRGATTLQSLLAGAQLPAEGATA